MKGKNGYIIRRGTADGLKAFKTACKKNGVTVGIGLVVAVNWAILKFNSSRDPVCYVDVNLRGRLGGTDLDKEWKIDFHRHFKFEMSHFELI